MSNKQNVVSAKLPDRFIAGIRVISRRIGSKGLFRREPRMTDIVTLAFEALFEREGLTQWEIDEELDRMQKERIEQEREEQEKLLALEEEHPDC